MIIIARCYERRLLGHNKNKLSLIVSLVSEPRWTPAKVTPVQIRVWLCLQTKSRNKRLLSYAALNSNFFLIY